MSEERKRDAERCKTWQLSRHGYLPRTWWLDPSWVAVRLARRAFHAFARERTRQARFYVQLNSVITGADVEPDSKIGPGLLLTNPLGVSIWIDAGRDLTFDALAGSGNAMRRGKLGGKPTAGDRVTFNAFSGAQGPIELGDDVRLTPGSGAMHSVAPGQWTRQRVAARIFPPSEAPQAMATRPQTTEALTRFGFGDTLRDWRGDIDRVISEAKRFAPDAAPGGLSTALLNQNIALLIHRVAHVFHCRGLSMIARGLSGINLWVFKLSLSPGSRIGPGVWLPHLAGTIVHTHAGHGLTAFGQSCIMPHGGPFARNSDVPVLGDRVLVAAHAGVFGPIRIGSGVQLSRKTNALDDVPDDTTVLGEAAVFTAGPVFASVSRDTALYDLPPAGHIRQEDRAARQRFEAEHGPLPVQSRLAVWLFRRAQRAFATGRLRLARAFWLVSRYLTGADIAPRSQIAPGMVIVCAPGVHFDGAAGPGLVLVGQCYVGGLSKNPNLVASVQATPCLGASITLSPHTIIYGGCTLGENIRIDPGATICGDVPSGSHVAAPKLRARRRHTQ
ncbi:hypothetical protein [Aliiroseovarius sp. PrR006]|uniref:hypothetical protein n=1 Tax=Aliiroseovarius sp. PrR006 TaxID=2706883 RepID=UPI0013D2D0A5|nr:hypothetical protein [Aliiroseovarius sp. PrR006]NDW52449.1 hypothetical protein [Aliiroseovarius sp. PrR006]